MKKDIYYHIGYEDWRIGDFPKAKGFNTKEEAEEAYKKHLDNSLCNSCNHFLITKGKYPGCSEVITAMDRCILGIVEGHDFSVDECSYYNKKLSEEIMLSIIQPPPIEDNDDDGFQDINRTFTTGERQLSVRFDCRSVRLEAA